MPITSVKLTIGTQAAGVVVAGPFVAETGLLAIGLNTITDPGDITVPTAYSLQVSNTLEGNDFAVLGTTSVTVTPDTTESVVIAGGRTTAICCKRWRIVSGGAFGSGTATLYIHATDAKLGGSRMNITSGGPITIGSQSTGTVVAGPYTSVTGLVWAGFSTVTGAAGITTPTAYTIQCSMSDTDDVWGSLPTTTLTITASASANAVVQAGRTTPFQCRRWRVISGNAFAAGTASLYVHGTDVLGAQF